MTRPSEELDLKLNENINTRNPNTAFWGKEGHVSLSLNHPNLTLKVGKNCVTAGAIIPRILSDELKELSSGCVSVVVLLACRTVWRQVLPSLVGLLSTGDSERQVQRAVCALLRVASYGAQNVENKVRHVMHDDAQMISISISIYFQIASVKAS